MKLYTEEQVKGMIEKSRITGLTAEYLILSNQCIELPSDEEIEDVAYASAINGTRNIFIAGAKWMRDKIQGDAK